VLQAVFWAVENGLRVVQVVFYALEDGLHEGHRVFGTLKIVLHEVLGVFRIPKPPSTTAAGILKRLRMARTSSGEI
jgi:hypothetical protein